MRRFIAAVILAFAIASAAAADASTAMKSPLTYSLQQYGLVLGVSILSALVRWIMRLRAGLVPTQIVAALIGEACISVFVGLLTFWLCEWQELPELLTIAMVALAGNMGSRALVLMERIGDRVLARRLEAVGIKWSESASKPVPLDDGKGHS
jgi:hypothetical protein